MCALRKSARVSSIQVRRAGLRAQRAVQKPSPWTFASVAGSLGVLLMVIMQLSYSFESLEARPTPTDSKEHPKTRIDPGLPQGRESDPEIVAIAQVDPFAPVEPNPFPQPSPEFDPTTLKPWPDPLDNAPPLEPVPAREQREPRIEPEPWVDPLDNLPPYTPAESAPVPIANVPTPPMQPAPPREPVPSEFSPFDPPAAQPEVPWNPPAQQQPENIPPKSEPEPWVDPLDLLPPLSPMPMEQSPPVPSIPEMPEPMPVDVPPKTEAEPWLDPLDNLPPLNPEPKESQPEPVRVEPAWPPMDSNSPVELGVGVVRLPKDDEERFLLESEITLRENLARELQFDAWDRRFEQQRESLAPRSYWERLSQSEKERLAKDLEPAPSRSDYDIGPEESRAELTVGLEKRLPPQSTAREPLRYEIVVENRGREMIDAVDVDESVPPSHQLTDVSPAGYFEDNLLRWRLKELKPGEQRRLAVEVVPTQSGTIETTTSVRPSIQVASLTNVERNTTAPSRRTVSTPPIRLRRSGYKVVSLEESVLFTNHVQNLSESTQRDLQIIEEVPPGFRVVKVDNQGTYDRQSGTITWTLASLPQGQTAELGVVLQALGQGELQSRVKGSTSEGLAVPIRARVQVEQFPAQPTRPQTPCRCPCCSCAPCRCR